MAGLGALTISASAILVVLAGASPAGTAFYRSALALPVLLLIAVIEQRRLGRRTLAQRLKAGLAGVFLAGDLILWTHAIRDLGAGVATVLGNLQVFFVIGIAWLLWRERPGRIAMLTLPVIMAGVILVSGLLGHPAAGRHPLAGIAYGIGTSVCYAGFLLLLRRSSGDSRHIAGAVADSSVGAAPAARGLGRAGGGGGRDPAGAGLGWLALLSFSSQTIGWLLITYSLPRLPAVASSLMLLLQPGVSLLLAAIILGESTTWLQLTGAALTCAGALMASLAASRAPTTAVAATIATAPESGPPAAQLATAPTGPPRPAAARRNLVRPAANPVRATALAPLPRRPGPEPGETGSGRPAG